MSIDLKSSSEERACIIFYHGNDWEGVRARQRYLMQALSQFFRIIYLDGGRSKGGGIAQKKVGSNILVISGLVHLLGALERRGVAFLAKILGAVFGWWVRQSAEKIVFWNAENWSRPFRFVPHEYLVYDCIDPCFSNDAEAVADFARRETGMLESADLVFASAETLFEACAGIHANVCLLNNACEPADYDPELLSATALPEWWPHSAKPLVVYLGTLDWRFDFELIESVCTLMPEVQFVLAGSVIPDSESAVRRLQGLPNVICPGRISTEAGHHLMKSCTVGLIPFREGEMNDAVNPVKLYAYALLGKQIVSTSIRELSERPEIASVASDAEEFVRALRCAIENASSAEIQGRLRTFALSQTWAHRAEVARERLLELLGPPLSPAASAVPESETSDMGLAVVSGRKN